MGSIKQYKQGVSLPQSQLRQNINLTIILLLDCIAQGSWLFDYAVFRPLTVDYIHILPFDPMLIKHMKYRL